MTRKIFGPIALVLLLGACGGGGSGGSPPPPPPSITLSPATLTTSVAPGVSATLTERATATDPSVFAGASVVYVYVVDPLHLLTGTVNVVPIDATNYSVTVFTSATLMPGRYQGTFQIQLCKDAACAKQFSGSPLSLPYDFTVTDYPISLNAQSSTSATMNQGGPAPADIAFSVGAQSQSWTASTKASWLRVNSGSGNGNGGFSVSFVAAGLAVGSYSDAVTLNAADGQTATSTISLSVLQPQFSLSSGVPAFAAINGAPIAPQTVSFFLDNQVATNWTATSSAPWMIAAPLSGITPGTISLRPDPTVGPLSSGSYSSNLVVSATGIPSLTMTSTLNLTAPTLGVASNVITLGGAKGRDWSAQPILLTLNTGVNAWPWSLSGVPAWLSPSPVSGVVDQTGTTLSLAPNAGQVSPGSMTATVTVGSRVNGDSPTLPLTVNLNADQHKLLASTWGVGLSSTPTGSALNRTLTIRDNFGGALGWAAVSDSAWLQVTSSGTTPGQLSLTANPASLPSTAISYATITISASVAGVAPAVVRVGLWKDSTAAVASTYLSTAYSSIAADTIRPYVYANNGGTTIDVYNAYTAQLVRTLTGVGSALGAMAVSPDGSLLYALDTAAGKISVVNLGTMTVASPWSLSAAAGPGTSLLAVRTNGQEVVLAGNGTAYSNGASLGNTGLNGSLTAPSDGTSVYTQDQGISPATVRAYDLDYSAISGGTLMVSLRATSTDINGSSNGGDIAVSPDGSRLYTATGAPYVCSSVNPQTLALVGSLPGAAPYPNNAEVTQDGRVICGINGIYSTSDFWVYTAAGALINSYKVVGYAQGLLAGQLVVTPDSFVVVTLTSDPRIAFVAIGP